MRERLHYIDIAKGLLIVFVVTEHMSMQFNEMYADDLFVKGLHGFFLNWVVSFFMPAFFVITGYCSNFGKDFGKYLLSTFIGLKMPVFFFIGILGGLALRPMFGFSPLSLKWWIIRMFDSGYWFLHALFLVKIAYWLIYRWHNVIGRTAIVFALYAVGVCCFLNGVPTDFWILNTLMLLPFIHLGCIIKEKGFTNTLGISSLSVFVCTTIAILIGGGEIPGITQRIACQQDYDPVAILVLASSGSIGFIWLCKQVGHSRLLEFIGKYSLVIYCVHFPELVTSFPKQFPQLYADSSLLIALNFVVRASLLIVFCLLVAVLLDRPFLRLFIGKKPQDEEKHLLNSLKKHTRR